MLAQSNLRACRGPALWPVSRSPLRLIGLHFPTVEDVYIYVYIYLFIYVFINLFIYLNGVFIYLHIYLSI